MNSQIDLVDFKISWISLLLILIPFVIGFFIISILIYTLKIKWKQKNISYNVSGIKIANEYTKINNRKKVMTSKYKFFHKNKGIYIDDLIAFNNSVWAICYSLFRCEEKLFFYRWFIVILQVFGYPLIFFQNNFIILFGSILIILSWFIGFLINFYSIVYINTIKKNIYKFMNYDDKKKLNCVFKYYKFYGLYISILAIPHILIDIAKLLKNNGIKEK